MPTPDPTAFGDEWVRAWNAHDVDAVLAHFHDDVVGVYRGESLLVINYRNERGDSVKKVWAQL